ncbi:hypothetical protein Tco_1310045 [Tanacetum coccineum]
MDQDSTHMVAASKVPMLKPGEFELWRMRIEQYIQMIDYALWEVIENGATLPKTQVVEGTKMPSEYQQDYKKTHAYVPKIYNDPNMTEELRDIYRALESRYLHEGTTINPSFYRDLSDDSVAKFTNIGKSKRIELTTSSSTESPPSDNGDLPSTKLSPTSHSRALKDDPNMSKEQKETRWMFKNLG